MYPDEDVYQHLAEVQLGRLYGHSPRACRHLQQLHKYGPKVVFHAAFAVELYQFLLKKLNRIPSFDYYYFIHESPQAVWLLDEAINCLLEDWLHERAQPEHRLARVNDAND